MDRTGAQGMKLYIQDHGVYGCIIVIAKDVKTAREIMAGPSSVTNYDPEAPIEEHEIEEGFFYENIGDR